VKNLSGHCIGRIVKYPVCSIVLLSACIVASQECIPCMLQLSDEDEMGLHDNAVCVKDDSITVNRSYLKRMQYPNGDFAVWLCASTTGNLLIGRMGKVIITGVPVLDNGADYFSDGFVRVKRHGKWGFVDRNNRPLIPPEYDGALRFEDGIARVCRGCVDKCIDENDCEHHYFDGGTWFTVDTLGVVLPLDASEDPASAR